MNATVSPTERQLQDQSLQALRVAARHCTCADRWHLLWAANKAMGLMRGMHLQQEFLRELMARHLNPRPRVLIGGAADTGSLDVLHTVIADPGKQFTLVDLCPAPLHLVGERGAELGVPLHTQQQGLDEVRADPPWDLVFVHYTLSFMNLAQRQSFMRHAHADLAPGGVVVCAVREKQKPATPPADLAAQQQQRATEWARQAEPGFERLCAGDPELLALLRQWAPVYGLSRMVREDSMVTFQMVADEFAACGFTMLESHRNPGLPVTRTGDLSPPDAITNWIAVFAPAPAA